MNELILRSPSLSVKVRRVTISSASGLEARRLADALLPALEQAFAAVRDGAPLSRSSRMPADRLSMAVREAVAAKLESPR
ncbi:hypothetical protein BTH42_32150 [Burkholderia sp. SRS-W-2-2016]|uniref:hypothetical protein n=1 Tax=Burkholderia sp. SRS-W-2-2016 TaxID=1926878 RepID=UPI00094B32D2|nr:hypothetical protein [Burkholderia sp. SRS-W-2-2016]OLL27498.1 hypothetical protein BTH42_32150 [Burkholderia sp. SRS-W-2-2016]